MRKHFLVCEFHNMPQRLQLLHHSSWSIHLKIFTLESSEKYLSVTESNTIDLNIFAKLSSTILLKSISKHQKASALSSKRTTKGDSKSLIPKTSFQEKYDYSEFKTHSIKSVTSRNILK